jgi:hypothetical protein
VSVSKFEVKSHSEPDELRKPQETRVKVGDAYTIPPGHDAWVDGKERFVGIEVMSAEQ